MKIKHTGYIENGKLKLDNRERFDIDAQSFEGQRVYVTISKETKNRSNNQNAYYWGVIVKMASDESGYTPDEIHELFLAETFGYHTAQINKTILIIPNKRSSKLNTTEFEELCETARMLASKEYNLYIPLPNEVEYANYD